MYTSEFSPVKVDLHFHTDGSPDGRTTNEDVTGFLEDGTLHIIAITDHDTVENALMIADQHPEQVIPSLESTTADGELVFLGVTSHIDKGMPAVEAAREAKSQGAKILLQHPFHKNGVPLETAIAVHRAVRIDLVETNNARDLFRWWYGRKAVAFATELGIPMVSNGDTHGPAGVGRAYTELSRMPDVRDMDDVINALTHNQIRRSDRFAGVVALRQPSLARREKRRAA